MRGSTVPPRAQWSSCHLDFLDAVLKTMHQQYKVASLEHERF